MKTTDRDERIRCPRCNGCGEVVVYVDGNKQDVPGTCPLCRGSGTIPATRNR